MTVAGQADGSAARLVDGQPDTSWQAPAVRTNITLDLSRSGDIPPIAGLRIEEAIQHGQRVSAWAIDVQTWGAWFEVARGTTIGAQRLIRLEAASGSAVRLRLLDGTALAVLKTILVYAGTDRMH